MKTFHDKKSLMSHPYPLTQAKITQAIAIPQVNLLNPAYIRDSASGISNCNLRTFVNFEILIHMFSYAKPQVQTNLEFRKGLQGKLQQKSPRIGGLLAAEDELAFL